MLRIEVKNQEIIEADIRGTTLEILADLGGVVNTAINLIADEQMSKEEVLEELTRLLKKYWKENDKEV
jgi:glutamate dehydrogenase/leucine dehydrogenase